MKQILMLIIGGGLLLLLLSMFATAPDHVQSEMVDRFVNPTANAERHTRGQCVKCKELDRDLTDGQCIDCWWPTK